MSGPCLFPSASTLFSCALTLKNENWLNKVNLPSPFPIFHAIVCNLNSNLEAVLQQVNPSEPHCGKTENAADLSAWSMVTTQRRYSFFTNELTVQYSRRGEDKKRRKRRSWVLYSTAREVRMTERKRSFPHEGRAFTFFSFHISAEAQGLIIYYHYHFFFLSNLNRSDFPSIQHLWLTKSELQQRCETPTNLNIQI